MAELVLRNGILDGQRRDVVVDGGVISEITDPGRGAGDETHDLEGMLLLPGMADPHAHLDKALTAERIPNPTGDLMGAIDAWLAAVPSISSEDIAERAAQALDLYIANGVTAVRSHSDLSEEFQMRSIETMIAVRDAHADDIDLQVCALTMYPLTGAGGAGQRALLAHAIEHGIDVVGGVPALDADPVENIAITLTMAEEAGLPVDLHVDETLDPDVLTLESLARQVIERGFPHPVTAAHCVSLGMQDPVRQRDIAALVAEAGISVVANPQTNLFLQGWGVPVAMPRGLTALAALVEAGVTVAAGGDNLQDPFNPVGTGDPLETASLMMTAGHVPADRALRCVTEDSRAVMSLPPRLVTGAPADIVAVNAPGPRQAIAARGLSRRTYKAGRLVASTEHVVHRFRG